MAKKEKKKGKRKKKEKIVKNKSKQQEYSCLNSELHLEKTAQYQV